MMFLLIHLKKLFGCEETINHEAVHSLPKWVQTTLRESKLSSPLPSKTRSSLSAHLHDFANLASSLILLSCLQGADEPQSFEEAQANPNWMQAMQEEISSIEKNQT